MRKRYHPAHFNSHAEFEPGTYRTNFPRWRPYNPHRWTPNYPMPRRIQIFMDKYLSQQAAAHFG